MELRGFSGPVRVHSQSGGGVVLRLDPVRREAAAAGGAALGLGMEPWPSRGGVCRLPDCPSRDGYGPGGAPSASAVFFMRVAVLAACGRQKAGVVHSRRDSAGAARGGCRVLEAGRRGKGRCTGPECGMAGARNGRVRRASARERQGPPAGGQRGLPGACPEHRQLPAYHEHQPFPFSEKPGVPG